MASTFSIEDVRRLEKTIHIREQMIDVLSKELPTKARDVECLTNLLESVDRSIFSKAKISLDEASNRVNEEAKEVLRDLLLTLHKPAGSDGLTVEGQAREIPVYESRGVSINDGELIPKLDNMNPDDVL